MQFMTKEEKAWIRKLQKLLDNPPSDRLGFFTTGDSAISIYDKTKDDEITAIHSDDFSGEFCNAVERADADFIEKLTFPSSVHSTCG